AGSLDVPARLLHRTLAEARTRFASELSKARADVALALVARPRDALGARHRSRRPLPHDVA
ncbi:MAG: hypothetical protein ABIV63_06725, partial [Caldimonas sp.]